MGDQEKQVVSYAYVRKEGAIDTKASTTCRHRKELFQVLSLARDIRSVSADILNMNGVCLAVVAKNSNGGMKIINWLKSEAAMLLIDMERFALFSALSPKGRELLEQKGEKAYLGPNGRSYELLNYVDPFKDSQLELPIGVVLATVSQNGCGLKMETLLSPSQWAELVQETRKKIKASAKIES